MSKPPDFDIAAAHNHFSAHCFNSTWDLIDKPDRSPDDDRRMIATCFASLYHWQQRPDCTDQNLSIGYWQLSRVYALLGNAGEAQVYGQACLDHSTQLDPFYLGYAYEALARAASVAGDHAQIQEYLSLAQAQADQVKKADYREMLVNDLNTIGIPT